MWVRGLSLFFLPQVIEGERKGFSFVLFTGKEKKNIEEIRRKIKSIACSVEMGFVDRERIG